MNNSFAASVRGFDICVSIFQTHHVTSFMGSDFFIRGGLSGRVNVLFIFEFTSVPSRQHHDIRCILTPVAIFIANSDLISATVRRLGYTSSNIVFSNLAFPFVFNPSLELTNSFFRSLAFVIKSNWNFNRDLNTIRIGCVGCGKSIKPMRIECAPRIFLHIGIEVGAILEACRVMADPAA